MRETKAGNHRTVSPGPGMEGMNLPCQANEMTGQWHDTTRSFSREVASSAHRIASHRAAHHIGENLARPPTAPRLVNEEMARDDWDLVSVFFC